jgi:hypothetical protein
VIEGYNGIGKTLSVRLLMLCTGRQPYTQHELSWSTLRDGLGHAKITATDLDGAASIEWEIDSRDWPEAPGDVVDESWLGRIRIDGRPAHLADVRALLDVRRIAGDVTLAETLARQADAYAAQLAAARARFDAEAGTVQQALDLLGRLEGVSRRADAGALDKAGNAADQAERAARFATERLAAASARLTLLEEISELRRRITRIHDTVPGIETELTEIEDKLEREDERREGLAEQVRQAETIAAAGADAARQLKNARRTADGHRQRLAATREKLAETMAVAGLDRIPERIPERLRERREAIDGLLRRRAEVDARPLVAQLLEDLIERLGQAVDAGLADQILVADDVTGATLDVAGLRAALAARAGSPSFGATASAVAASLDQDIARETDRLRAAEALGRLLEDEEKFRRLADSAAKRVAALTERQSPAQAAALNRLRGDLHDVEKELVDLSTRRVLLLRQKEDLADGSDGASLAERLAGLLEQAGTDEDRLGADLGAAAENAAHEREELTRLRAAERDAVTALAAARADLHRAVTLLNDADEFAFLRGRDIPLPREHDDERRQTARLGALLARTLTAQGQLQDVPNRLLEMQVALTDVAGQLRGRSPLSERYRAELTAWLESKFTEWFRQPTVVEALFPGAEGLSIDLTRQAVIGRLPGGSSVVRPFDAFSSGEQAFAYTRAQLEALGQSGARNRLVVLDEFGAFVAHNRRDDLRQLLLERSRRILGEQAVVILPVTQDYDELASTSSGAAAIRHTERADELRRVGYFAEEFAP